ncbi:MAG TPA: LamG-like jellyroll fold domain-containing protein [Phycisphaerales bacterium]
MKTAALLTLVIGSVGFDAGAQVCTGQIGWWRFDGNVLDASGLGHDGTFFGGTPNFVTGKDGLALELDGADDFVRVANTAALNPSAAISLVAWARVRPFSGSGSDPIIDKAFFSHSFPFYQYHIGVSGSQYPTAPRSIAFITATTTSLAGSGAPTQTYTPGEWFLAVGTYDGAISRFYFNGEQIASASSPGTIANYGSPLQFGKFNNLNLHLPAAVDDIRIFDRALSADEVAALYLNPAAASAVLPTRAGVCAGGAVTLRAAHLISPGATYTWKLNGTTLGDGTLSDGTIVSGVGTGQLTLANLLGNSPRSITCVIDACSGSSETPAATIVVCAADLNCDANVDDADFSLFAAAYNLLICDDPAMPAGCPSDLNRDGGVDDGDFSIFAAAYNELLCP